MSNKTRNSNYKEFKSASYFRLLKYTKPYWFRLTLGILAGFVVGGSLFSSLIVLPKMMMIVETDPGTRSEITATASHIIREIQENPDWTEEQKLRAVEEMIHPVDNDPQLTSSMDSLRKNAERFHLPITVNKRSVDVHGPFEFNFPVVDDMGRMSWQFFSMYVLFFVLAWMLKNLATYVNHYFTRWVGPRVIADMREEIYTSLIHQSMCFYGKQDIGHLISRCTNDTAAIEASVSDAISDATRCPIEILACISAVIYFAWQQHNMGIMLLILIGMPICVIPIIVISKKVRKIYRKTFANIADVFSRMHETFTGILVVKANHMEDVEIETFRQKNNKYFKNMARVLRIQLLMQPMMEMVTVSATLCFLVYSYSQGVTISQMVVVLAPAVIAYRPIKDIARVVNHLQRSMAAADRYFDLVDTHTELKEIENPVELKEFKDSIEFHDVKFAYDPSHLILKGVSFKIKRGSMVAVVGGTGSGKTTIANLIARFYDVTGGSVTIDGVPVQNYSIASIRSHIGIVTQDPVLFNDTIAHNIAYGNRNATMDEVIQAAKEANAHNFIVSGGHPEGYQEEVGEKGFKLSGGEKQRIAIARAILKNPPILILDEATSALDTVTEKLVQDALNRVMTNRTVFAIAHRLSTIQNADQIIVLDKGRIVESGTHEELLALGGRYAKLYEIQFRGRKMDFESTPHAPDSSSSKDGHLPEVETNPSNA